jgi:hypothetical protein
MIPINGWDWQWIFRWGFIVIAIDPCDVMIGVAWGPRDLVIKPLPCVIISIETYEQE